MRYRDATALAEQIECSEGQYDLEVEAPQPQSEFEAELKRLKAERLKTLREIVKRIQARGGLK